MPDMRGDPPDRATPAASMRNRGSYATFPRNATKLQNLIQVVERELTTIEMAHRQDQVPIQVHCNTFMEAELGKALRQPSSFAAFPLCAIQNGNRGIIATPERNAGGGSTHVGRLELAPSRVSPPSVVTAC
jgi:hypothetical protein